MGRLQDPSDGKMNGKQRLQSDGSEAPTSSKKRKTAHENEKPLKENSPSRGAEPTPTKDRRSWSQAEEVELVKVLLEHKREGRMIPLQSKTATYWTELITLLYPGEKGITQRRLYDKVRRMHLKYNESKQLLLEKQNPFRNKHEEFLFDFWEKIFVDEVNGSKASQELGAKVVKVSPGSAMKVAQVTQSSSEEEEEDDHEEERVLTQARPAPSASPPTQASDGRDEEEEEEDEDFSSPEKRRPVHSGQIGARAEGIRLPQELRKTASVPRDANHKAGGKSGSKHSGGSGRNEKAVMNDRLHNAENRERRPKCGADQSGVNPDMIKSLKTELFEYVQNLRNDCMRELEEVKSQLMNPARLQIARRRQELILEELSLQEKELEISRRYCRLQKEAFKLQPAS